ncbi:hypothetical protein ABZ863_27645 [Saccharomonospora sp. NPDC046836]|uniref:carboxymuconolactone decarboxylase family protein n=1 Tax=Saccharomonospora sp. NPDC046836 TaxID=3156921 RepID=UPI0033E489FB
MTFFPSLPEGAGPPAVFAQYPEIYRPWSEMSEALMNGPSSIDRGERELLLAFAAGVVGCDFVAVAHAEVAYAWGIEHGLVERLLDDPDLAAAGARLQPVLRYLRTLMLAPDALDQSSADAVFDQGWDEQALHDAIAIAGRAAFMRCLTQGHGFVPPSREVAARHARRRVERGYVNLYSVFRPGTSTVGPDAR